MTNLYDGQITDLIQNDLKRNPETQAIAYAVLQEKRRLIDLVERTRLMSDVDNLEERILDYLAVELRTPAYKDTFPIETKRKLIKGTLSFYAKLGTPSAVNWVIRSVFGNGNIEEWFSYDGEPHYFRVNIPAAGMVTPEVMDELRWMLDAVKRLTSWLDYIVTYLEMERKLYITPMLGRPIPLTRLPELEPDFPSTLICFIPAVGGVSITTLPELEDDITTNMPVLVERATASAYTVAETSLPELEEL